MFGLGSSAYPNFCAFAHSCRDILHQLGGNEIHPIGEGDELRGQEDSFKKWAKSAFKVLQNTKTTLYAKIVTLSGARWPVAFRVNRGRTRGGKEATAPLREA